MSAYMQNYLHRRLLRLAGQPDTATDYYEDQPESLWFPSGGVNCIIYDGLTFTENFNRSSIPWP